MKNGNKIIIVAFAILLAAFAIAGPKTLISHLSGRSADISQKDAVNHITDDGNSVTVEVHQFDFGSDE